MVEGFYTRFNFCKVKLSGDTFLIRIQIDKVNLWVCCQKDPILDYDVNLKNFLILINILMLHPFKLLGAAEDGHTVLYCYTALFMRDGSFSEAR